jgi:hypothetical protein
MTLSRRKAARLVEAAIAAHSGRCSVSKELFELPEPRLCSVLDGIVVLRSSRGEVARLRPIVTETGRTRFVPEVAR